RAKAQVLFSLSYLVAAIVAPPLGGWLVLSVSWRAIFLAIAAIAAVSALAIALTLRDRETRRAHRLDWAGAATLVVGAGSPLLWRWGYRTTSLVGMLAVAGGFVLLSRIVPEAAYAYPLVLLAMLVQGLGLGFVNTAVVVAVQNAVPWGERGAATAAATFFRS